MGSFETHQTHLSLLSDLWQNHAISELKLYLFKNIGSAVSCALLINVPLSTVLFHGRNSGHFPGGAHVYRNGPLTSPLGFHGSAGTTDLQVT